ncbi:MAG: hypothetical protein CFE43_06060 [Burkholderiales bacterium PBB3]|nr:MAG: hypothetical protein CFE43_06060 [Burkholderiales bacterium PBB3]
MASVLYISAAGPSWWDNSSGTWLAVAAPSTQATRVVADLTEETFVEIAVPRVFGNDRKRFVQRQLANRFPESQFRAALVPPQGGGLMDRLAPPKQVLTAIEPSDRLQAALQAVSAPIVGIWGVSVILAQLGQSKSLPATLLIVLSQASSTRIVFLKDRAPVLTRLVAASGTAAEQAVEILRTVRHLENTKVLERGAQRLPALLLGTAQGLAGVLSGDRIDAVAAPGKQWAEGDSGWRAGLFDLACKGTSGQLAPVALRASYLTSRLEKAARIAMVACLVGAAVVASGSILSVVSDTSSQSGLNTSATQLAGKIAAAETSIEAFGVSPELLRKVLALDSDEIGSALDLQGQLGALSRVVGSVPGARVTALQWQFMAASETACPAELGAVPVAGAAVPEPAVEPRRKVEVKLSIALAADAGPRLRLQQASKITTQLGLVPGAVVVLDPARALREGDIGSVAVGQADDQRSLNWCVALPAATQTASVLESGQ